MMNLMNIVFFKNLVIKIRKKVFIGFVQNVLIKIKIISVLIVEQKNQFKKILYLKNIF